MQPNHNREKHTHKITKKICRPVNTSQDSPDIARSNQIHRSHISPYHQTSIKQRPLPANWANDHLIAGSVEQTPLLALLQLHCHPSRVHDVIGRPVSHAHCQQEHAAVHVGVVLTLRSEFSINIPHV